MTHLWNSIPELLTVTHPWNSNPELLTPTHLWNSNPELLGLTVPTVSADLKQH